MLSRKGANDGVQPLVVRRAEKPRQNYLSEKLILTPSCADPFLRAFCAQTPRDLTILQPQ